MITLRLAPPMSLSCPWGELRQSALHDLRWELLRLAAQSGGCAACAVPDAAARLFRLRSMLDALGLGGTEDGLVLRRDGRIFLNPDMEISVE